MQCGGNAHFCRSLYNGPRHISARADNNIGSELLYKLFRFCGRCERKPRSTYIRGRKAASQTSYVNMVKLVARRGHKLVFDSSGSAHKRYLRGGIVFFYCICNCKRRIYMASGAAACHKNSHFQIPSVFGKIGKMRRRRRLFILLERML